MGGPRRVSAARTAAVIEQMKRERTLRTLREPPKFHRRTDEPAQLQRIEHKLDQLLALVATDRH